VLTEQLLEDYISLFRGRGDCYGAWEGGCVREELTRQHFREHLTTGPHIGVYPCVPYKGQTMCVWGCSDIDYDSPEDAWLLADAFSVVEVKSWVEKTRRGYHVWVFTPQLIEAKYMRRMFLAAHDVVQLPPKEVNPKQESLATSQVGNYVRLPYPNVGSGQRVMVDKSGNEIQFDRFLWEARENLTPSDRITKLASMYRPPQAEVRQYSEPSGDLRNAVSRLTTTGRAIFRDGPLEGRDRSTTLIRLAYECRDSNLNPNDARQILEDADLRWGKFLARGQAGQRELEKLLARAYGHTQST